MKVTKPCHRRPGSSLNNKGYATFTEGGVTQLAHRAAWEKAYGPIPAGLEIDHDAAVCGNRWCDEITHLRLLTHRNNLLASPDTLPGHNARKTHCINGHPFDAANTYITKQGKRWCRTCDRERHARAAKERS